MYLLKFETNSQTNLTRAERARGYEKGTKEILTLEVGCSRSESIKVYKLAAEAEDCFVEYIVKLDHRAQTRPLTQAKFARDIQIKEKLSRPLARVPRQIT